MQTKCFFVAIAFAMLSMSVGATTTTVYAYDTLGRATQITLLFDADAHQTLLAYDSTGNLRRVTKLRTSKDGSGPSPVPILLESLPLMESTQH